MKQYQVYWVSLDPTVGAEMKKTRPCIIVSPNQMNRVLRTVTVVPLTTAVHNFPFRTKVSIKGKQSFAAIDQMRGVDKSRIGGKLGQLLDEEIVRLRQSIIYTYGS